MEIPNLEKSEGDCVGAEVFVGDLTSSNPLPDLRDFQRLPANAVRLIFLLLDLLIDFTVIVVPFYCFLGFAADDAEDDKDSTDDVFHG